MEGTDEERPGRRGISPHSVSATQSVDTGLSCLVLLARFFGIPADAQQLRHQFVESGKRFDETDLLRAAQHLGLKAGAHESSWERLASTPLPALAHYKDGRYVALARVDSERVLIPGPTRGRAADAATRDFRGVLERTADPVHQARQPASRGPAL